MPSYRSQTTATAFASAAALLMLAQLVAGKATRDALFLANFEASSLPAAMIAAGLVSLVFAVPTARALTRFGPGRIMPWLFALSGAAFLAEWLMIAGAPRLVAVLLYLHAAVSSAVLISGFWSIFNERFDPHSAKRNLARISSFATLGGLLGGLMSERSSSLFGLESTLLMMSAMHLLCAAVLLGVGESERAPAQTGEDDEAPRSSLTILRQTPYLRAMFAAGLVLAMLDALLDYVFKAQAAASFQSGEQLIRFFAFFYTAIGVATFGVQALFARRMLARRGIGAAMASLPIVVGVGGLLCLGFMRFWTVILMRASASVLSNSFFRTGFELLYTPLPPRIKRPTKTYVDVGGQRLGDIAGGLLVMLLLALLPAAPMAGLVSIAIALSGALYLLATRLQRAYADQLARNLQSGEISLESMDALARTVAQTQIGLDRSEILARIHEVRARASGEVQEPAPRSDGGLSEVIGELGHAVTAARASATLRAKGSEIAPELVATLLDPEQPELVKMLLPAILVETPSAAVVEGLAGALYDESFEVRHRSARAAARIVAQSPDLRLGTDVVHAALLHELSEKRRARVGGKRIGGEDRRESPLLADFPRLEVDRTLEHVFTIMALHADHALMTSVLLGLHSVDSHARGTALEYVEATLPESVRAALRSLLGESRPRTATAPRGKQQIEAELLDAVRSKPPAGGD